MSTPRAIDLSAAPHELGVIAFRGPDAARFLQGQLSADVEKLAIGESTLAGLHNPQGRVIALLALARTAADEIFSVLPRELLIPVAQRLGKYVLRAKVRIVDESETVRVLGFHAGTVPVAAGIPLDWFGRRMLVVPAARLGEFALEETPANAQWERANIAAGLPQVYAATSETFVAQMLNLDLLGAIAFDKGCYTGQEVVARAHYRGRVKRRMQRWRNPTGTQLRPGDSARGPDGRALTVVHVAPLEAGGQDVLAVGNYFPIPEGPTPEGVALENVAAPGGAGNSAGVALEGPLPLPYSLPE